MEVFCIKFLVSCVPIVNKIVFVKGMEGSGMEGPAWKRQRLDSERGLGDGPGASRQDSVFYKTRMCHKRVLLPLRTAGSSCNSVQCAMHDTSNFHSAGGKKGGAPLGIGATMHMGRRSCGHCRRKATRSLNAWTNGAAEKMCSRTVPRRPHEISLKMSPRGRVDSCHVMLFPG